MRNILRQFFHYEISLDDYNRPTCRNKFDAAKNLAYAFDDVLIHQQGVQDCVYLLR